MKITVEWKFTVNDGPKFRSRETGERRGCRFPSGRSAEVVLGFPRRVYLILVPPYLIRSADE